MKFQKSTLATICTWVHAFFLLYGIYPLLAGIAQLQGVKAAAFCLIGLLLFVPILLSWWLLRKLHRLWLYLPFGVLISALCGALAWLFAGPFSYRPRLVGAATCTASLVLFLSHAVARIRLGNLKKEFVAAHGPEVPFEMKVWEVSTLFTNPHPAHLTWFAGQYLVGLALRAPFYWHFMFYLTFADLFVLFGFRYLTRLDAFIVKNRKTASLPLRTMGKIHHILFGIGLLLILLFSLPALFYGREPLADVSLGESQPLDLSTTDSIQIDYTPMNYDMTLPDLMMDTGEPFTPPAWLEDVVKAILFLILAIALIGLIYAIYLAICRAGENFSVENEDEVIFLDSKEDSRHSLRKKGSPREGRFSPNMQIRRRYKRTIRKYTKGKPTFWASPSELESQAGLAETADMQRLHGYYEKARYSKEGCTREDVAAIHK